MAKQLSFTVVIPAYNKADYISRTIRSVLNQTHQDWRMIVVDDGSTDATLDVVKRFTDQRISVIHQSNQGVSVARNRGIEEAQTEWICLLDADDAWLPEFLERVAGAINAFSGIVAVFSNGFFDYGRRRVISMRDLGDDPFIIDDYCRFFLNRRDGINCSRVAIRKSAIQSAGGFPVGWSNWEDMDTWARLAWSGRMVCIPTPLSVYHFDDPNSASRVRRNPPIGYAPIWQTYQQWKSKGLIERELLESAERYAGYFVYEYVIAWIRARDIETARHRYHALKKFMTDARHRRLLEILLAFPGNIGSYLWDGVLLARRILGRVVHLFFNIL